MPVASSLIVASPPPREESRLRLRASLADPLQLRLTPKPRGQKRLAPAEVEALGRVDGLDAFDRLVGDERRAGVVEAEFGIDGRLGAVLGELRDRLERHRSHLVRILLAGGADDARLD